MSKFQKGNKCSVGNKGGRPSLPEDIKFLRKESQKEFLRIFEMYGNMPLTQLMSFAENKERLNAKHQMMITFWKKAMTEADPQRMKLIMNILGIPTDIKAIGIAEINMLPDDTDLDRTLNERKVNITDDEVLEVIALGRNAATQEQDD